MKRSFLSSMYKLLQLIIIICILVFSGFQPETNEDKELQQFFIESSEEIEKENLLL